jgi:hypothetical protein
MLPQRLAHGPSLTAQSLHFKPIYWFDLSPNAIYLDLFIPAVPVCSTGSPGAVEPARFP